MGNWEKEKKLGLFLKHYFRAQGWSYKFFHQSFGKVSVIWLLPNIFLLIVFGGNGFSPQVWKYIYISFWSRETSEDLIICIPILLKYWKILSMIFYLNLEGFSTLYLMPLFGWMFLNYYCSFFKIVIIIKRFLSSWKNLLNLVL